MSTENDSRYTPVRHKKLNGTLVLSAGGIQFSAETARNQWEWKSITKHQVSPANYPKFLLKLVLRDKTNVTFQLPSRQDLDRIRQDVTVRLQSVPAVVSSTAAAKSPSRKRKAVHYGDLDPTALAVTRSTLLASHPTLRQQHQHMVPDIMEEEDFWQTHADLVQEEYARIAGISKSGASSLLQSHVPPTGKVKLGVEEMRQIFILYPAVHKAYEEKVPLELSDEQFWRKYLESEYFHRDRGRRGALMQNGNGNSAPNREEARAAAVGTDDIFSRYDQKLRDSKAQANVVGVKPPNRKLALGQFDLASTMEVERSRINQGVSDNHPGTNAEDERGTRVISKYNRHWAMVLHPDQAVAGSDLTAVARQSAKEDFIDDDCRAGGGLDAETRQLVAFCDADPSEANHVTGMGPEDLDYEPLTLVNIEAYYGAEKATVQSEPSDNAGSDETARKNRVLSQLVEQRTADLVSAVSKDDGNSKLDSTCFPPPDFGQNLLKALTKRMIEDSQTEAASMRGVVQKLPQDFCQQLQSYTTRSSELLRHFFGLRRLETTQPTVKAKIQRIMEAMKRLYGEMDAKYKEFPEMEHGDTMGKMLFAVMEQLNWAFQLHASRGSGGGFVAVDEG